MSICHPRQADIRESNALNALTWLMYVQAAPRSPIGFQTFLFYPVGSNRAGEQTKERKGSSGSDSDKH